MIYAIRLTTGGLLFDPDAGEIFIFDDPAIAVAFIRPGEQLVGLRYPEWPAEGPPKLVPLQRRPRS